MIKVLQEALAVQESEECGGTGRPSFEVFVPPSSELIQPQRTLRFNCLYTTADSSLTLHGSVSFSTGFG
ncbi:hypothetical protein AB205_0033410 [Aquarana catesbeiana]|uniref:Uncharacterized protein n=1 Tax=Aquarana catesbeiana TaxID=8400 RepID=A0A2G9RIR7_AQUCT|nr:hypothetical protein AB205_0033410 [Aquarana catesbeiana]